MFENYIEKYFNTKDEIILKSESWTTGGTWGSCWNDQLTPISPEPAPTSFYDFDEFLGDIVPDIKFMQYKAIEGRFISSDEDSDSDYYGGVQYSAYFTADIRGVLDYLIEHDIISVDELKAKM